MIHVRGVMGGHQVGAQAGDKAGGGRASDGTSGVIIERERGTSEFNRLMIRIMNSLLQHVLESKDKDIGAGNGRRAYF